MEVQYIMEMLAKMKADIKANQAKADTNQKEMKENMKAIQEKMINKMNMNQKKMEAAIQSKAMHGKKRSKPEKKR
jgi:hypothetical protein